MAIFKCKQTGNTVEFDTEHDVKAMRAHPDYDEVQPEPVVEKKQPIKKPVTKDE